MKRKNTRGIPKFAYGGQVGDEILDFQRQYNPFTGDLPTYGMVGSQQPGAWMFFDDAWLRSGIPQPPPSTVVAPPSPPVMGDTYEGPDGGSADRYQDDWRGYGYGVTPADFLGTAADNFADLYAEPGYDYGAEMVSGYGPVGTQAPVGQIAGLQDIGDVIGLSGVEAASRGVNAPDFIADPGQLGISIADRPNAFVGMTAPELMEVAQAKGFSISPELRGLVADYQAAAKGYAANAPARAAAQEAYLSAPDEPEQYLTEEEKRAKNVDLFEVMRGTGMIKGPLVSAPALPSLPSIPAAAPATPGLPVAEPAVASLASLSNAGLGGLSINAAKSGPGSEFDMPEEEDNLVAPSPGTLGPVGLGGLAAPNTPAGGAAMALADLYGFMPNDEYDFMAGALAQPQEPTNTVAGPATPGAPVGISAPAMDPLAGLTDQQIEALAAGYHDQAPAVGVASPVAGFETALAAAQAAAERAAENKGGAPVGAGSSGGVNAGRGMPGAEYTGSSGVVGDKQGPTGEMGGNTGDNSGSGPTGNDAFGGTDSSGNSSDGGSGTDGGMGDDSGASGTSGGSGDEGGVGAWKAGGRVKSRGLPSMADQVAQAGRGNDTVLAHITPDEAARLDAAMGGPSINPETGLREYGFFDDIGDFLGDAAKAVAPIAGGVLGGMFGGPLGAAAGAALGTTLVGGNLQEALLSGGVAGIGAYAAPKMAGGAEGLFGGGDEAATLGGGGTDAGVGQGSGGGFLSGIMGNPLAMVGLGAAGGLGAGYMMGDNDTPSTPTAQAPAPWVPRQGGLAQRNYRPYEGNYSTYGQVGGGGGHQFYDQVNPGVVYYAEGGSVEAPSKEKMRETLGRELLSGNDMTSPMSVLQIAQMAMPRMQAQAQGLPAPQLQEPQQLQQPMPPPGQGMVGQWQQQAMPPWLIDRDDEGDNRIANLLWKNAGGGVKGPGHGQEDLIPAMLSNNEYIVPADVSVALGTGDPDLGADRLDKMVANVRRHRNSGGTGLPPVAKDPLDYMGR